MRYLGPTGDDDKLKGLSIVSHTATISESVATVSRFTLRLLRRFSCVTNTPIGASVSLKAGAITLRKRGASI